MLFLVHLTIFSYLSSCSDVKNERNEEDTIFKFECPWNCQDTMKKCHFKSQKLDLCLPQETFLKDHYLDTVKRDWESSIQTKCSLAKIWTWPLACAMMRSKIVDENYLKSSIHAEFYENSTLKKLDFTLLRLGNRENVILGGDFNHVSKDSLFLFSVIVLFFLCWLNLNVKKFHRLFHFLCTLTDTTGQESQKHPRKRQKMWWTMNKEKERSLQKEDQGEKAKEQTGRGITSQTTECATDLSTHVHTRRIKLFPCNSRTKWECLTLESNYRGILFVKLCCARKQNKASQKCCGRYTEWERNYLQNPCWNFNCQFPGHCVHVTHMLLNFSTKWNSASGLRKGNLCQK